MIDGLIGGKVYGKPARRVGQSGKAFVTAKVRTPTEAGDALFVNVIPFYPLYGYRIVQWDIACNGERCRIGARMDTLYESFSPNFHLDYHKRSARRLRRDDPAEADMGQTRRHRCGERQR